MKLYLIYFRINEMALRAPLILDGTEESVRASLLLIEAFGNISGLRLNNEKTEALWIGSKRNCNRKLCPEKNFKWQKGKVKVLGVWLSTDHQLTLSLNYNEKLAKIQTVLGCWKFRRLSLIGKITVLKSLVASQLVYILTPLQTNHQAIKEINKLFFSISYGTAKRIKLNTRS